MHQHHPGDDGVFACVQVYEVVQDIQTCFECAGPTFWRDHTALDQSRKSHDSRQNLNHTVCSDPIQAAYPGGHRHKDPLHKASNALSPVNKEYLITSCFITSKLPKFILYMDTGLNLGIKLDKILYEIDKSYAPQKFIIRKRKNNTFLQLLQQFFLGTNVINLQMMLTSLRQNLNRNFIPNKVLNRNLNIKTRKKVLMAHIYAFQNIVGICK
jgi:hypothetical protein